MSGTTAQNGTTAGNDTAQKSPEAIEAEIERTRAELADTVDALHHKLDVKEQARIRAERLKAAATTDDGKPSPAALGVAAALVATLGLLVWRRSRR